MGLNPMILRQARALALSFSSRRPPALTGALPEDFKEPEAYPSANVPSDRVHLFFRPRAAAPLTNFYCVQEFVREHHAGLHSFRSMRRIEARRRKASALWLRHSQSLASRRQRPSQANVRSTIQRLGSAMKPVA